MKRSTAPKQGWTVFSYDLDSSESYTDYAMATSAGEAAEMVYAEVKHARGENATVQVVAVVRGHVENSLF